MGVYIPGMKMPEACFERGHGYVCPYIIMCPINKEEFAKTGNPAGVGKRLNGCPLIEVSVPHGRLIDANMVVNYQCHGKLKGLDAWMNDQRFLLVPVEELSQVETVIEAEE